MYPSQTSLIPVTVALAKFIEDNGFTALTRVYPYWYLGTPFRFLTGPLVPIFLVLVRKVLPGLTFFNLSLIVLFVSYLISIFGWFLLIAKISNKKKLTIWFGIVLLFLPWRIFEGLAFSELSVFIAKAFLPFVLLVFYKNLKTQSKYKVLTTFLFSLILLINTAILPILLVGSVSLILTTKFTTKNKLVHQNTILSIKRLLSILIVSLALVTLWYTPGYWVTILTNPSIGGFMGINVILKIGGFFRSTLPLLLAFTAVFYLKKKRTRIDVFTLAWILPFGLLTIFRFIADPDFWQDWTAWLSELEIGLALVIATLVYRRSHFVTLFLLVFLVMFVTNFIYSKIGRPFLIDRDIPAAIKNLEDISEIVAKDRIFLSGSTVFWSDALYNIYQVRGGVDRSSINPLWRQGVYQLREGSDPNLAHAWLKVLGVSYVLVHNNRSIEYYHDFNNTYKWEEVGKKIWEKGGDSLYKIDGSYLAWSLNSEKSDRFSSPPNGESIEKLNRYTLRWENPLSVNIYGDELIISSPDKVREILVLITYNKNFSAINERGERLMIYKDDFGNTLIHSLESAEVRLYL